MSALVYLSILRLNDLDELIEESGSLLEFIVVLRFDILSVFN